MNFSFSSLLIILAFLAFGFPNGIIFAQAKPHFVIDAGHGGRDPGTQQNGLNEKDLTLDLL